MLKKIKHLVLGQSLRSDALDHEKFSVIWGLPVLSSDAISSVSYACEENSDGIRFLVTGQWHPTDCDEGRLCNCISSFIWYFPIGRPSIVIRREEALISLPVIIWERYSD